MMKQISTIWTGKFSRIHWKHSYSHQNKTQLFRHVCVELKAYLVLLFIAKKNESSRQYFPLICQSYFSTKRKKHINVYILEYIYIVYTLRNEYTYLLFKWFACKSEAFGILLSMNVDILFDTRFIHLLLLFNILLVIIMLTFFLIYDQRTRLINVSFS